MKPLTRLLVAVVCVALAACGNPAADPATLVITDTRVWTGNPEQAWAEAVAIRGNRIAAVGTNADIGELVDDETRIIVGTGNMLVPGFIDTHVHFLDGGVSLASVQLRDAETPAKFTRRIGDFAAGLEPGEWILAGAWDHENWGGELPHRAWIDAVTPDNPVWISRLDGHMALANSLALEAAGVDADTANVDGGEIVRDDDGSPTGVLKDNAMPLVSNIVPVPGNAAIDRQINAAMDYVASNGVTTVHDMASGDPTTDWRVIDAYRRLNAAGAMKTRVYAHVSLPGWERLRDDVANHGRGDDWLRTGALKGFMDGSLGSHTAAFFEPFDDAPGDTGLILHDLGDMQTWIAGADEAGLHVAVHAIGDRANAKLLNIYEGVIEANGERDRRFRVEHAQHLAPDDIPRFGELGVIPSMQPYHAIDDGRWAERIIGPERIKTTYAFRSLLNNGATLAFGSDWFVAPADVLAGIYAAVTRRTLDGANPDGWVPGEKITVDEALRAYTVTAAYASFDEDKKGMIRPGMLADLTLIDRDLTQVPPETIRDARILTTIVDGKIVYDTERDTTH